MAEKLLDYFGCGVELVWYVDPAKLTARVFTSPDDSRLLRGKHALDGGTVLPGFVLPLRELFADPLAGDPRFDDGNRTGGSGAVYSSFNRSKLGKLVPTLRVGMPFSTLRVGISGVRLVA